MDMSDKNWKKKNRERVRETSRLRRIEKKNKLVEEERIKNFAALGKLTPNGQKICLHQECSVILSRYNQDQCCSQHQKEWFAANRHQLEENDTYV
jgi:hypothetical protein